MDRKKNIIRRSGENIAAAEVENCILEHDLVVSAVCLAIPDELREEEILACIVLKNKNLNSYKSAQAIFEQVYNKLAYFKAPGWILFVDDLPRTGTQKILKHKIFPENEDPKEKPTIFDFTKLKRRKNQ